jgi:hypothetical protein
MLSGKPHTSQSILSNSTINFKETLVTLLVASELLDVEETVIDAGTVDQLVNAAASG